MTRRQGRRRKKLLDDLKDRRGYCHLKEEAVDRNMCGGIVLEKALNLSSGRLQDDDYGTTVVYAVRRWPKRRYASHDCMLESTWKFRVTGHRLITSFFYIGFINVLLIN